MHGLNERWQLALWQRVIGNERYNDLSARKTGLAHPVTPASRLFVWARYHRKRNPHERCDFGCAYSQFAGKFF
jgi:hypothetical protein